MSLWLSRIDRLERPSIGNWAFGQRPYFMRSAVFVRLKLEIERYLRGEVSGRSFLIAGHRGIGKTSLARRVIEDLEREIFSGAVDEARAGLLAEADRATMRRAVEIARTHKM